MTRYEDYDERNLADIVFDEIPYVRDAFEEYTKDKEEINDDERLYRVSEYEKGYDF